MKAMEAHQAPVPVARRSSWASVREALAGTQQDYTEGPLGRAVFLLAIALFIFLAAHVLVVRRPAALGRLTVSAALVPLVAVPVLVYFLTATDSSTYLQGRLGLKAYDTEERFVNHGAAIATGMDNPLGIGPGMYSPTA